MQGTGIEKVFSASGIQHPASGIRKVSGQICFLFLATSYGRLRTTLKGI
jgi:hypothetical protein